MKAGELDLDNILNVVEELSIVVMKKSTDRDHHGWWGGEGW